MSADATDSGASHTTEGQQEAMSLPWAGDPCADAKTALLKYARQNAAGAPVIIAVRAVVDGDAIAGDADHCLALRFYRNHPDLFKTARRDGLVWVEPRPAAFHLTANMQETKHAEGGGVAVSGGESEVTVGNSDSSAVGKRAEETAARVLSGRRVAGNDDARGTLLDALTTCRETTEDVFWVPVGPGETALVPYRTRFNAPSRARRSGGRVEAAFRNAREEGHERALLVTLTTDPARHESVRAALDALGENVSRFKSWYAGRFNGGSRQPWVVVREVTESGLPHAHIVLFGEGSRRTRWCPTIRRRGGTTARWCGATVWRYAVGRGYGRGVGRVMDRARGTLRADGRRGRVGQWGICRRWAVTWRRSHW